ncbi:MAG: hypothetical protein J6B89_02140 [Bacilli bacterium]|nr:hypothetical protein [Bacilli bacterium]
MKLKKSVKRFLWILAILIVSLFVVWYLFFSDKKTVKKVKVLTKVNGYGYELKDNKSKEYKDLFYELEKVLKKDSVNYEDYAKTISKMFILDYYSLNEKIAKTDVGGVDFVHSKALTDFLEKSENTIYKYVESNLYGGRKQSLPTVDEVTVDSVDIDTFEYLDTSDSEAYVVKVHWTYKDKSSSNGYQDEAVLTFVHEDKKLSLVELK